MSGLQAVVLAAGAGSRFGGRKLLAPWQGRPLILWAVESALAAPVDEVIVVLGCEAETVAGALLLLAGRPVRTVIAPDWAEGLSASLKAGIRALPADSLGLLLYLGDMPAIPAGLASGVAAALQAGATAAQPRVGDTPGHPVGLSRRLYPDLLALTGDAGAGQLLKARDDVVRIEVADAGAVLDIDRPDQL